MIGERINNYTILSLLGQGGMGTVYAAEHALIGRKVAVKVLRREYAENNVLVTRFINEARAAHAIRHPNIVDILDAGTLSDGRPYLMMELLEGQTLARRIGELGRLSIGEALGYAERVTSAVGAAHAQGIVHRDLKPDNIFLAGQGAAREVKILDFGIAKLQREMGGSSYRTNTGALLGTPPYMSPEQCRGLSEDVDHRTDVYALGIILYEMLCGAPPFASRAYGDVLMMHMSQPPRPPREINDAIPPAIEEAILRALTKDKHRRFASMAELQTALGGSPPSAESFPSAAAQTMAQAMPTLASTMVLEPRGRSQSETQKGLTTLSSTASQIIEVKQLRPSTPWRRSAVILGAVAGAVVTAVTIIALLSGSGPRGEGRVVLSPSAAQPAEVAPPPRAEPVAPPEPVPAPVAERTPAAAPANDPTATAAIAAPPPVLKSRRRPRLAASPEVEKSVPAPAPAAPPPSPSETPPEAAPAKKAKSKIEMW